MILKIWDINPDHRKGWIYFDHIEKIRVVSRESIEPEEELHCAGGIFANVCEPLGFKIADIERAWGLRDLGENITVAFNDAFLLGDDGKTIERL